MARCRRLPTDTAPAWTSDHDESARAAGIALTIQIVANQQCDAPQKQERGL